MESLLPNIIQNKDNEDSPTWRSKRASVRGESYNRITAVESGIPLFHEALFRTP